VIAGRAFASTARCSTLVTATAVQARGHRHRSNVSVRNDQAASKHVADAHAYAAVSAHRDAFLLHEHDEVSRFVAISGNHVSASTLPFWSTWQFTQPARSAPRGARFRSSGTTAATFCAASP